MVYKNFTIQNEESPFAFSTRVDNKVPWWRDLDMNGQPLYRIGNMCDTCQAILSQLETATLPIEPKEISQLLREGKVDIPETIIETISKILPSGNYDVGLVDFLPNLKSYDERFYWENAQPPSIPMEYLPVTTTYSPSHLPKKPDMPVPFTNGQAPRETIYPLIKKNQINPQTTLQYQNSMEKGVTPIALSLSIVDVRFPSGREFDYQLIHFLLDGHHKTMAASNLNKNIKILSFLALNQSFSDIKWINLIRDYMYKKFTTQ